MDENITRQRIGALTMVSLGIYGQWIASSSLQTLATYVGMSNAIRAEHNVELTPEDDEAIRAVCQMMGMEAPSKITLFPMNCPAAVIHRRAITVLPGLLTAENLKKLHETFPPSSRAPETEVLVAEVREERAKGLPVAFDSHFHLDRLAHGLKLDVTNVWAVAEAVRPSKDKEVELLGGTQYSRWRSPM